MSRLAMFGGEPVRTARFPSWPVFDEAEERAVVDLLRSGNWWRYSYGEACAPREPLEQLQSKVGEFQTAFAQFQGARYAIACANGTAALEVSLKALGIGPGDEVIVPPYTFAATATAPLAVNAVPVFCDIDYDTFNLDPVRFEEAITPRTRAVVPVHFAGLSIDMQAVKEIAGKRGIIILEDAAHGHGGSWNDRGLGTIGAAGTFSFQASKNMTAGEGGLITTDDPAIASRCESYIWGGREIEGAWYEHFRLGWNYRMTEFAGAILLEQLKRVPDQNRRRAENALYLNAQLSRIAGIRPLAFPPFATSHSFHLYVLRFSSQEFGIPRASFLHALQKEGIPCSGGYAHPLYRNPMFLRKDFYPRGCPINCGHYNAEIDYSSFSERCPNAERACREAIWLEHRVLLGARQDMDDIVSAVQKIYECRDEFVHEAAGV